ncbi:MAG: AAA family ATPase, partial [Gammaproteobacteria bacterium]|nr:AAA family ATPase [Gammaproteobacteria bacterium]
GPFSATTQLLKAAPNLESLEVYGIKGDLSQCPSLPKLRSLNFWFEAATILEQLLKAAPNLESLEVYGIKGDLSQCLSLPKLGSLNVEFVDATTFEQLFNAAPKLEWVNVYEMNRPNSFSTDWLTAESDNSTSGSINGFDPNGRLTLKISKKKLLLFRFLKRGLLRLHLHQATINAEEDIVFSPIAAQWRSMDLPSNTSTHDDSIVETMPLTANQWTLIPTNSAGDQLIEVTCRLTRDNKETPYELQYDAQRHLYRIKTTKEATCQFHLQRRENSLLLEEQIKKPSTNHLSEIWNLFFHANTYQDFVESVRKLEIKEKEPLIQELMAHIKDLPNGIPFDAKETNFDTLKLVSVNGGACEHRAKLFCAMANALDIDCRLVFNKTHAFVEWRGSLEQPYQTCSLGGGGGVEIQLQEKTSFEEQIFNASEADKERRRKKLRGNPFIRQALQEPPTKTLGQEDPFSTQLYLSLDLTQDIKRFQNYLLKNDIEYLYIDSPETTREKWKQDLLIQDKQVAFCDGELPAYLKEGTQQKVLLINWDTFSPEEKAAYQSFYDTKPTLYGSPIPEHITVIGFLSKQEYKKTGADFRSRAPSIAQLDWPTEAVVQTTPTPSQSIEIPLYGDEDFESLIRQWSLTDQGIVLKPGLLASNIPSDETASQPIQLTLINPPKTEAFQRFYEDLIQRKKVYVNGAFESLPEHVTITCEHRTYPFEQLFKKQNLSWSVPRVFTAETPLFLLNPFTFHTFFTSLEVKPEQKEADFGRVTLGKGILEKHRHQHIVIRITQPIRDGQWAQLLENIADDQSIEFQMSPKVSLPQTFPRPSTQESVPTRQPISLLEAIIDKTNNQPTLLVANDTRQTVQQLQQVLNKGEACLRVITLNAALNASDVLLRSEFSENTEQGLRSMKILPSDLVTALRRGDCVIVHTDELLSPDLLGKFEPLLCEHPYLWINGQREPLNGRLYFVTTEGNVPSSSANAVFEYKPEPKEHTQDSDNKAPVELNEQFVDPFMERLQEKKYLFLKGPTCSGKTYFVQHILRQKKSALHIHSGIRQVEVWLEKGGVLFIDEANLQEEALLSLFKGIQNNPSSILLNGKLRELTDQHFLVFAGNPDTYHGRRESRFLSQCVTTIEVQEMPKEKVQSIFNKDLQRAALSFVGDYNVAKTVAKTYREQNLIYTAREARAVVKKLEAIASLKFPQPLDLTDTQLACYLEMDGKIRGQEKNFLKADIAKRLEKLSQPLFPIDLQYYVSQQGIKKFAFVPEYREAMMNLHCGLYLRDKQQGIPRSLLLEGPSGIGKSSLVAYFLKSRGFVNCTKKDGEKQQTAKKNKKAFYQITADLSGEAIENIIKQAFEEGAIAVVDEVNLLETVEKDLNAYLQGEDENGQAPKETGFWLIATQNPASQFRGRKAASPALLNRFTKVQVSEILDPESLQKIANKPGDMTSLIEHYREAKADGYLVDVTPTLRDFITQTQAFRKALSFKTPDSSQKYEKERSNPGCNLPQSFLRFP